MSWSHFQGPDIHQATDSFRADTSTLKILIDALRRNGDHVAMIEGDTGKKATFQELLQQGSSIAAGLQDAGVCTSAGDVVVLCCDKSILAYCILLGVIFTGGTAVLAPPPHADMIDKLTSGKTVKAVFYDSLFSETVSQSLSSMTPAPQLVAVADPEDPVMASFLTSTRVPKVFNVQDVINHVPVVFFTSGTTGVPKGVEISDVAVQISGIIFDHKLKSLLIASPLYWYSALFSLVASALNSYPLILTNSREARHRLQLIEKYQVETIFSNLAHIIQYTNEPTLATINLSSLKRVFVGGEIVLPSVARQFVSKVLGGRVQFYVIYGTSEAGILTNLEVQDVEAMKLGACGTLQPGVDIKILDDHRSPVKVGTLGRVWVKSLSTKGFWNRPELNDHFLDKDGFYDTGDAGFFDSDGHLYLRGRICDLINFRGVKNSPVEIEDLLMSHPAVQDVVVVGKPHPSDVQLMTSFVVIRPSFKGSVTEEDLRQFVDEKVKDDLRLRGGVHFRAILPRVSVGKVIRKMV